MFDDAGRPLVEAVTGERRTIQFHLPAGPPRRHAIRFRAFDPRPASDLSPAAVRVFGIRAHPLRPEIVPLLAGFRIGRGGWYTLEEAGDEAFRWVNGDAEIVVTEPGARALELDVAPGPALGSRPLTLDVRDGTDRIGRFVLGSRQRIRLELPHARAVPYAIALRAEHRGSARPGHPRVLTFRVFHIPPI
ncbi:MAG TPA: hypothetical protein VGX96_18630 [Candidatus Elarobacter sp.]|nr:hypothetical protein [Candidatus Elarobacter sp.]